MTFNSFSYQILFGQGWNELFSNLGSNISSTENYQHTHSKGMVCYWQVFGNLISDRIKQESFQVVTMSVLLFGCTTKYLQKKLDLNYTRMLQTVLNKSWKQHPTVRPLTSPLTNHPSKTGLTCLAQVEN